MIDDLSGGKVKMWWEALKGAKRARTNLGEAEPGFFPRFAANAFLDRLAGFLEASNTREESAAQKASRRHSFSDGHP